MQIIGTVLIIIVIILFVLYIKFLRNRTGISAKVSQKGIQQFKIIVKGVYSPSVLTARAGEPVKIIFIRQEESGCSRFVNFPDFNIRKELPQNKEVTIEFIPQKAGEYAFACDMNMYRGVLKVE